MFHNYNSRNLINSEKEMKSKAVDSAWKTQVYEDKV